VLVFIMTSGYSLEHVCLIEHIILKYLRNFRTVILVTFPEVVSNFIFLKMFLGTECKYI